MMDKNELIQKQKDLVLSNRELAIVLDKHEQTISNYRTGRTNIPSHVKKLIELEEEK